MTLSMSWRKCSRRKVISSKHILTQSTAGKIAWYFEYIVQKFLYAHNAIERIQNVSPRQQRPQRQVKTMWITSSSCRSVILRRNKLACVFQRQKAKENRRIVAPAAVRFFLGRPFPRNLALLAIISILMRKYRGFLRDSTFVWPPLYHPDPRRMSQGLVACIYLANRGTKRYSGGTMRRAQVLADAVVRLYFPIAVVAG